MTSAQEADARMGKGRDGATVPEAPAGSVLDVSLEPMLPYLDELTKAARAWRVQHGDER